MHRGWRWAFKNLYLALNANNHLEIQEPFLPDFRNCNFLPSVRFLRYCFFLSSQWFSQGTADTTRAGPCCRYWFCFSFQAYLETRVNNFPTFYLIKEWGGGGGSNFSINEKWDDKHEMLNWTISFTFPDGYFQRVCEGGHLSINCGSKVANIKSASYGRTRKGVCAPRGYDSNSFCYSASSMRVTLHRCQGQHRCTVYATNSVFGDPCVGTAKYLEVCLGFNTLY